MLEFEHQGAMPGCGRGFSTVGGIHRLWFSRDTSGDQVKMLFRLTRDLQAINGCFQHGWVERTDNVSVSAARLVLASGWLTDMPLGV
jgi:hypothetical protein